MVSRRENAAFKISCLWKKDRIKRQNVWWRKVWIITIIITDVAVVRDGTGGLGGLELSRNLTSAEKTLKHLKI